MRNGGPRGLSLEPDTICTAYNSGGAAINLAVQLGAQQIVLLGYDMGPDEHGVVDDQPRIDYLESHLNAVATAIQRGVDVRGYYHWSLMDNFEWAEGYEQRFGLVWCNHDTQERIVKASGHWYGEAAARNGFDL